MIVGERFNSAEIKCERLDQLDARQTVTRFLAFQDWEIERIVAAYADAAERCIAGGMDGIELMGNGHLLDQFWSPATNHRDDEWGGDFERRLRFPLEVLRAIRARVGSESVIGLRMAVDEVRQGGLATGDGLEIARRRACITCSRLMPWCDSNAHWTDLSRLHVMALVSHQRTRGGSCALPPQCEQQLEQFAPRLAPTHGLRGAGF